MQPKDMDPPTQETVPQPSQQLPGTMIRAGPQRHAAETTLFAYPTAGKISGTLGPSTTPDHLNPWRHLPLENGATESRHHCQKTEPHISLLQLYPPAARRPQARLQSQRGGGGDADAQGGVLQIPVEPNRTIGCSCAGLWAEKSLLRFAEAGASASEEGGEGIPPGSDRGTKLGADARLPPKQHFATCCPPGHSST